MILTPIPYVIQTLFPVFIKILCLKYECNTVTVSVLKKLTSLIEFAKDVKSNVLAG